MSAKEAFAATLRYHEKERVSEVKINREKIEGVFVYLAQQEVNKQEQVRRRNVEIRLARKRDALPTPDRIIAVLIELIQRIELEPKQLACRSCTYSTR